MLREIAAKVKEIKDLVAEHSEITSIDIEGFWNHEAKIFVGTNFFFDYFKDESITEEERTNSEYPYEYSTNLEGVKVYCISKERQAINDLSEVDRDTERAESSEVTV